MNINLIKDTCSMLELGGIGNYTFENVDRKRFIKLVNSELNEQKLLLTYEKNYSILYNCTSENTFEDLKRIGFKHVFTYDGSSKNVKVLILEVNKRLNWIQRLFNF